MRIGCTRIGVEIFALENEQISNRNPELIWNGIKLTCKIKRTYWKPFLTLDPRSDIFDIPNRFEDEIDFLFLCVKCIQFSPSSKIKQSKAKSRGCALWEFHTVRIPWIEFLYDSFLRCNLLCDGLHLACCILWPVHERSVCCGLHSNIIIIRISSVEVKLTK